jgi:hypothetical protein
MPGLVTELTNLKGSNSHYVELPPLVVFVWPQHCRALVGYGGPI